MNVAVHSGGMRLVLAVVATLAAAGCDNSGLNLAPVEGTVTLNGAPVANAAVMFAPSQGLPAMGLTDDEGEFSLRTANRDGALVGEHSVSISKVETIAIPQSRGFPLYDTKYLVPKKYAMGSTSGLTANVVDDDNYFEFKLTGQ